MTEETTTGTADKGTVNWALLSVSLIAMGLFIGAACAVVAFYGQPPKLQA